MSERTALLGDDATAPADGLAGLYAMRALERGADPRQLAAECRTARWGAADRPGSPARGRRGQTARAASVGSFGRGTAAHKAAMRAASTPAPAFREVRPEDGRFGRSSRFAGALDAFGPKPGRRFVAAGLAALVALPLAAMLAAAEPASFQARYLVQPGDTLSGVADQFGVDPEAILAASYVQAAPVLTPGETIVIPEPEQSIEDAIATAAALQGTSPFVTGAHVVQSGETLGQIAAERGLDAAFLARFNGLPDIDVLNPGDRLLLPPIMDWPAGATPNLPPGALGIPGVGGGRSSIDFDENEHIDEATVDAPEGTDVSMDGPPVVGGPVLVSGVPTLLQRYGLSSGYAAASMATAAFGAQIDEDVFRANIGQSENPHWGYRGWIDGTRGGTDDYGIYPEALAPTLQANGFVADVFYANGDASQLTARLDDGMPVVAWLGVPGEPGTTMEDAGSYRLVPGMQAVTVYGYDDGGVYVSDPGSGTYGYDDWDSFMGMWAALDGMSMGVAPAR